MISKDLQLLNPADRRRAVLGLLAHGLWCPNPELNEPVGEGFVARLQRMREVNRVARVVVGKGYESGVDDSVLWPYLWRASGWAQQQGMEGWVPGRPFCKHWRNPERFASLVRGVCGETGVDLGQACEQGLVSFAVLQAEGGHMLVHLTTTDLGLSSRDLGALEASATQVMRSLNAYGGGAGVLGLSVALGRPNSAGALVLPDSGLALAFGGLGLGVGEVLTAAIDEYRA